MFVLILLITLILVFIICKLLSSKPSGSVPGPICVPYIGYWPLLIWSVADVAEALTARYGKIFKFKFFGFEFYFLNDLELLKEAFITKGKYMAGRPGGVTIDLPNIIPHPLAGSQGEYWKVNRGFYMRKLSELGAGRTDLEVKIMDLCNKLVVDVENTNGTDYDFYEYFTNFHFNIISTIFYGKTFDCDHPEYVQIRNDSREFFLDVSFAMDTVISGPVLYLLALFKETNGEKGRRIWERSRKYFLDMLENRLQNYSPGDANDMLDLYIEKYLQAENGKANVALFNKNGIADLIFEAFIAGVGTTTSSLLHAIYQVAHHSYVQSKMQSEIDSKIGKDLAVSLRDQSSLNYCMAVINEIQRCGSVIPLGLAHEATEDLCIGGYKIPKGAIVSANLYRIAHDERYFKNAKAFDPSNFLDQDNNFVRNEANNPFSAGVRQCAGFNLAQAAHFLCFITLLQKFRWKKAVNGASEARIERGMPRDLTPFKVCATKRH